MPYCTKVFAEKGVTVEYMVGTNDLTQTTLGMSRDDYGGFINHYKENDIVPNDPHSR